MALRTRLTRLALLALALALAACDQRFVLVHARDGAVADAPASSMAYDLSCGVDHTCMLLSGALWCTGHDATGQLGLPDGVDRLVPTRADVGDEWVAVSSGYGATCLLGTRGGLSCFGDNSARQLATGDTATRWAPTPISLPRPVVQFAFRFAHGCAVLDDASLWCWGSNAEGELGQGDGGGSAPGAPVRVGPSLTWAEASCGQGHTCAITTDGALYCWGRNGGAQGLGAGMLAETSTPMRVGSATWRHVAAGQNHTCAIAADGTLWCWGWDTRVDGHAGPVGLPTDVDVYEPMLVDAHTDWSVLSTDTFHTCGVRAGELWCWGRNIEGQLGTGDVEVVQTPTRIGTEADWARVSAGRFFTCAQKQDGTVWCTGDDDFGETGIGPLERRTTFSRVAPPVTP